MDPQKDQAMSKRLRTVPAGLMVLVALCSAVGLTLFIYPTIYSGRIYPGVSVGDTALDGLTVEEAASLLTRTLPDPETQVVTLQRDGQSWEISWADAGRTYRYDSMAQAAYQVGRQGPWHVQVLSPWRVRFEGRSIEVHGEPGDPSRVRAQVEAFAHQLHVPPTDATLSIRPHGVTCVPSAAGQAVDVKATTENVMVVLDKGRAEVEVAIVPLPPEVREPEPGCTKARSLLSEPFTLVVDDPLTNYLADFDVPSERMATWLHAVTNGDQIRLEVDEATIESWLLEVAPELGPERILEVDETLERVAASLRNGDHRARSAIRHPEKRYVVQPGDTMFDIAYSHGFPQWRLEEANPDVEPNQLLIGMALTIPSIDVLFPEPLVPGKRIEIDLPEQRLRAYENDELAYDFTCSSGMTSTPTIAGQFQVLFKEPEAYAQRWSLEMPYFMAIYYEGPDFANGIHELPIRSSGQRLWASVLGWPASYGCIILDVGDAKTLYDWAPVGTLVRIEGVAPGTPAYVPTYDDEAPGG